MKKLVIFAIIAMFASTAFAGGYGRGKNIKTDTKNENLVMYLESIPVGEVDELEIEALKFLIEEEKLARDVYTGLSEKWGIRVFDNIASAEQTHMDAVEFLFDRYGIDNPTTGLDVGRFTYVDLQDLYSALMGKGSLSMIDALVVGATIEDMDIKDLQLDIGLTDNEDLLVVFQNLMKGSRNHLRAFVGLLESNGETYVAQYLTQGEVDEIVTSDRERGVVDAEGKSIFSKQGGRMGKK